MGDIPAHLECAYCVRNFKVGGPCHESRKNGCLAFKQNPLGCIQKTDTRLILPLFHEIPKLGVWNSDYTWHGKETKIRVDRFLNIVWDSKKGYIHIDCEVTYFANDFDEGYEETKKIPNLKLIKCSGGSYDE